MGHSRTPANTDKCPELKTQFFDGCVPVAQSASTAALVPAREKQRKSGGFVPGVFPTSNVKHNFLFWSLRRIYAFSTFPVCLMNLTRMWYRSERFIYSKKPRMPRHFSSSLVFLPRRSISLTATAILASSLDSVLQIL